MREFKIMKMNLSQVEIANLESIGISIGSIVKLNDNCKVPNQLCVINFENSTFCFKKDILENIELEPVK